MNFAFGHPATAASAARLCFAPLEIPLCIETPNAIADAVAAACRGWEGVAAGPALEMRVESLPVLTGTGEAEIALDGATVTIRGRGVLANADLDAGFSHCAVSAEYLREPAALHADVIEPLVLMMLSRRDRTPLHASGFIAGGLAILLAGHSGAGKSCLARAADLAGFQVLSDDAVFVRLEPGVRVWGWPSAAYLCPQDAPGGALRTRLRKGKVKQVVPLRSATPRAVWSDRAALCVLSRGATASLSPLSPAAVHDRLWPLDEGFDRLEEPIARAVSRLSARGAWDLRLSADPDEAIRLLVANLATLEQAAGP